MLAIRAEGHAAALAGASSDSVPYGNPPFPRGYELHERSTWLYGWWDGQRTLKAMATEAVDAAIAESPVALAAIRYASAGRKADRDGHEEMAAAARDLLDALKIEE